MVDVPLALGGDVGEATAGSVIEAGVGGAEGCQEGGNGGLLVRRTSEVL